MFSRRTRGPLNVTICRTRKGITSVMVNFTYQRGDEYVDVFGAWDWNLIPGTTVVYGATQWNCATITEPGLTDFVGGTTLGDVGIAVMHYIDPQKKLNQWKKTYFFFPGAYAIDLSDAGVEKPNRLSQPHPLVTTIDQRKLVGELSMSTVDWQERTKLRRRRGYGMIVSATCSIHPHRSLSTRRRVRPIGQILVSRLGTRRSVSSLPMSNTLSPGRPSSTP